ncbi:2,4-dihydroxyhept-2-ene-1,7-dioic acid aldolase [Kwoniella heveanensis BCC8398]|uniref:2,4-dihydroxyhept-2-ene-1,7-dioic acid aldolase n=1 Tax=Kwoniella heveanensis BCC8398 TaxID=1296120 RepID=A0A1B9GJ92_9TREE|nr:2,4-dihydroxyhept-2-ene-1,7-dioic acid aldolase [Kwoniella heveanensis BCC8398]
MSWPSALTTTVQNPRLKLMNQLRTGQTALMTFIGLPSVRLAQIVSSTGLDAVIVDCEHGNVGDDQMHNAVAGIAYNGVSPIIRIRSPHPDLIKRALDTGAHGLMIPMINTAEEAAAVVKYSKLPPRGLRGQGSPFLALAYGLTIPEYNKQCNETLLTIVQIETREGVENVDSICAVEGVDMIFIGPNDLAMSLLGYAPAKGTEPVFLEAIEKVVKSAKKHGKWISRLVYNGQQAKEATDFDCLAVGSDSKILKEWFTEQVNIVRG